MSDMSNIPEDRSLVVEKEWWEKLPRAIYSTLERIPVDDAWFEVYKVIEGTFVIYEPGQYEEAISNLVIGEEKSALIDTGCGIGNIKHVVEELTDLPVMVINTHSHNDHVAQNYLFEEVAMFDHPWSHRVAEEGLPQSKMIHLLDEGMVWKQLPENFNPRDYHVPQFEVTTWLEDGDLVDLGERELEIIHTPGHSPDSICLLDRVYRLLFTGDMFYTGGIYTYLPGGDLSIFIESYRRMLSYYEEYDRLMPSHNEPWVEKVMLKKVLSALEEIAAGEGTYGEGFDQGIPIRKYDYGSFSIITKDESKKG